MYGQEKQRGPKNFKMCDIGRSRISKRSSEACILPTPTVLVTSTPPITHVDVDLRPAVRFAISGPVCKVCDDPVETATLTAYGSHLCGLFPATDGGDPWAKALQSAGQEKWATTIKSILTGRNAMIQKGTAHQRNCQAQVCRRCILGIISTLFELIRIFIFTISALRSCLRRSSIVRLPPLTNIN